MIEHSAEQGGDRPERGIAGSVAVGVVEEPEPVDVEQGDRDRLMVLSSRFDTAGEAREERAVVQQSRRGIATSGLHQFDRLPTDSRLGGPKDQEEEHGSDHRAR